MHLTLLLSFSSVVQLHSIIYHISTMQEGGCEKQAAAAIPSVDNSHSDPLSDINTLVEEYNNWQSELKFDVSNFIGEVPRQQDLFAFVDPQFAAVVSKACKGEVQSRFLAENDLNIIHKHELTPLSPLSCSPLLKETTLLLLTSKIPSVRPRRMGQPVCRSTVYGSSIWPFPSIHG